VGGRACRPLRGRMISDQHRRDVYAQGSCFSIDDRKKIDSKLRSFLKQEIDADLGTFECGLDLLDARIREMTTRVRSLQRKAISVLLNPQTSKDPTAALDDVQITNASTVEATADFARLGCENKSLITKSIALHESISVSRWRPQDLSLELSLTNCLYKTPQESPGWMLNGINHASLLPALNAATHQRMRRLCSYMAEQARYYNEADMRWRSNLCENMHRPLATRNIGARDGGRVPRSEHTWKDKGGSHSLFSLDSSRPPATQISASSRSRKALRDENSEHERLMSQILASSAKEARVERGALDDNDLPLPLPVLAHEDARLDESSPTCRQVVNPCIEEAVFSHSHQWSDLEKCIFLDKFLQYPKNFGKIAAFLTRKRARDCVRLYYDSKHAIDYKAILREHQQRRRGVKISWSITARAVETFGGKLDYDPRQNMVWFRLPESFTITPLRQHPSETRFLPSVTGVVKLTTTRMAAVPDKQHPQLPSPPRNSPSINTSLKQPKNACQSPTSPSPCQNAALANSYFHPKALDRSRKFVPPSEDVQYLIHPCSHRTQADTSRHFLKTCSSSENAVFPRDYPGLACAIPAKEAGMQTSDYFSTYKNRLGLKHTRGSPLRTPSCGSYNADCMAATSQKLPLRHGLPDWWPKVQ